MTPLVLSLFPGIGLLDRAFEEEGFCVVRGPDVLWGGDVKRFHPPAGKFDGVIGGPPCQRFSTLSNINRVRYGEESLAENLIPEYERVVAESQPDWALMENVPNAPEPCVAGYRVASLLLNNRDCGGDQHRERRFSLLTVDGRALGLEWWRPAVSATWTPAATSTAGGRRAAPRIDDAGRFQGAILVNRSASDLAQAQGLPADFLADAPFTTHGRKRVIANGVPLPMGRAIARAVKTAMNYQLEVA